MAKNKKMCDKYNLHSVRGLFTGAAPLGEETAEELQKQYPAWEIRQGYGSLPLKEKYLVGLLTAIDRAHGDCDCLLHDCFR